MTFRLVRLLRTLSSEVYVVWDELRRVGQVDLHYADSSVHANLMLETDLGSSERSELLRQLDEDIVSSYLPPYERDEFIVTIFRGEEEESFNYPSTAGNGPQ